MRSSILSLGFGLALSLFAISAPAAPPATVYATMPAGLTVLDEATAQKAFAAIASDQDLPYRFPDGCEAKAQAIALLLDQRGIVSGKAFLEGAIYPNEPGWGDLLWTFHVAPVILVGQPGNAHPYVIDPHLSSKLLSYEEWYAQVTADPRTKITQAYFTNRFVYIPAKRYPTPTQYDPALIADMNDVLAQLRSRLAGIDDPKNSVTTTLGGN